MELRRNINRYDSIIWVLFFHLFMSISCSVSIKDPNSSFGEFVHKFANNNNSVSNPKTGILYNISLPSNFSGIQVSYIRLRSGSFWVRGTNLSLISIPPRFTPVPYVKRIAIVFENFGNWSSTFYKLPGYTLVSPVIGFTVYDSSSNSSTLGKKKLHLVSTGRNYTHINPSPILVRFPKVKFGGNENEMKCVKFGGGGGKFEMKNMTGKNLCSVNDYGHFSIVIPNSSIGNKDEKKKKGILWEWWVVGFGGGLVCLCLVSLVLMGVLRFVRTKNLKDMERESETGVSFDTIWIGKSKMPSASMVRTQPYLENSYVP